MHEQKLFSPVHRSLFRGETKMKKFSTILRNILRREEGATMVEYGLMVALIAVVAVAGVTTLGGNVKTTFESLTF
jgi:pilus assembly protein Flp/PilA